MVINKLKLKSASRYIKKKLQDRKHSVSENKIMSVTVIVDVDAYSDVSSFESLLKPLNVSGESFNVIAFSSEKKTMKTYSGNLFTSSKISWGGAIKDSKIKEILRQPTDLLINYYNREKVPMALLTVFSEAQFKVGFYDVDHALSDLIINCNISDFETFSKELIKYLMVLNKL